MDRNHIEFRELDNSVVSIGPHVMVHQRVPRIGLNLSASLTVAEVRSVLRHLDSLVGLTYVLIERLPEPAEKSQVSSLYVEHNSDLEPRISSIEYGSPFIIEFLNVDPMVLGVVAGLISNAGWDAIKRVGMSAPSEAVKRRIDRSRKAIRRFFVDE